MINQQTQVIIKKYEKVKAELKKNAIEINEYHIIKDKFAHVSKELEASKSENIKF